MSGVAGMSIPLDAPLATDILSSFLGGLGCWSVVAWIARTPGRSFLERRAVPLLANMGAIYMLRCIGWLGEGGSLLRWLVFWPATLLPITMGLFVEGLLRRHLPRWLKWMALGMTSLFMALHVLPEPLRTSLVDIAWPLGMAVTMGAYARRMWMMRHAGLSREEQQMIAGVVVAALVAIPLVPTDTGYWIPTLPNRLGAVGGLLFTRVLLTPPAREGIRDAVGGLARVLVRGVLLAGALSILVPEPSAVTFVLALTLAICLLLLYEILDRLRARVQREAEGRLLRWLVDAPSGDFEAWRAALKQSPVGGDAIVLDGDSLAKYDARSLAGVFDAHGGLVSEGGLRQALERAAHRGGELDALEQVLDLVSSLEMTHAGLISQAPLRVMVANVSEVAGRDAELRLRMILRSGREAAGGGTDRDRATGDRHETEDVGRRSD